MARIRSVKPELFKNEDLAALGYPSLILFIGLWQHCDVAGRCEDRPMRLKIDIFPYQNEDVDALLNGLEQKKFLVRYEVDGEKYIWVRKFREHQRITGKEAESGSKYPAAPEDTEGPTKPRGTTQRPPVKQEEIPQEPTEEPQGSTWETPGGSSDALEGKGKEVPILNKVDREEPPLDSSGDEPSGLSFEESLRAFWTPAGKTSDPVVKALCKACYSIPKFRGVVPPSLATVEKVVERIRRTAPHDAAILAEIELFELYWSSQTRITGKGQWWLSIGKWCDKQAGKWALAKKRGGLMAVNGGVIAPLEPEAQATALETERRRLGL